MLLLLVSVGTILASSFEKQLASGDSAAWIRNSAGEWEAGYVPTMEENLKWLNQTVSAAKKSCLAGRYPAK